MDDQMATSEELARAGQYLAVHVPLVRDIDARGAPDGRARFLDRVCAEGSVTFRRDTWPIDELGVSLNADGSWSVRVVTLSVDRNTKTVGRTQSGHDWQGPDVHRDMESLACAVRFAIVQHIDHEVRENLYAEGARILDPHRES